jgi:hypothetical protein
MAYSPTGPFTNNTVPPGISATFLNNVENFLVTVNSAATDSNITSGGSGNLATTGTIQMANNKAFQSKDSGGTVRTLLIEDGSNQVKIGAGNANNIILMDKAGAALVTVSGSGLVVNTGTLTAPTIAGATTFSGAVTHNAATTLNGILNLINGSISRIAFGFNAVTTGGTTITHSLGAIPSGIFVQVAGLSATAFVTNYSATNTMTVTVSTNCNVWWLVIA